MREKLLTKMLFTTLLALLPLASALYQNGSVIAPCDSPLYCQGEILREIELARPFEDSKLYVDLYVQCLRRINA
jgi:alpha,alpha-trehalase